MLSVAAPIWLIGLAVIPLVWWLHRLGDPDAAAPVSAVFLFYTQVDDAHTRPRLPRASPLWILRATLLSLLVLALAGPGWIGASGQPVTVWFDDSLSMQARESGLPRTTIAARRLSAALDEADAATVRIRSLSDHRRQFDASALAGEQGIDALVRWAEAQEPGSPQIPFALPPESQHWLVSDGADHRVNAWRSGAAFAHRITVGSATENAVLTALMARRALQPAASPHGSVRVHNPGTADQQRTLTVRADGRLLLSEVVTIPPDGSIHHGFAVPADAARVVASLLPADALAADDTLEIALDGLRPVAVDFDSRCGARLRSALNANPGVQLRAASKGETGLTVRCAPTPTPASGPTIIVHTGIDGQPITGPVQWHRTVPGLSGMALDPSWLRLNTDRARPVSNLTLLGSPSLGLSLIDMGPGAIDVYLDLVSAPVVERPEYPLLVNALAELALQRPLLDPIVRATRDPAESRIARQPEPADAAPSSPGQQARTDLTPYLVVVAMLLLLADVLASSPAGRNVGKIMRGSA